MIPEGTKVLLVDGSGKKHVVTASKSMIEVGKLGVVDGSAICSSAFGGTIRIGAQEFRILRPSVKDLLSIIERRAQIMIPKDSFVIPFHLDLSSGSKVIEGGVGSGALTLVLLKAVSPDGKVFSYETRADYADIARKNISMSEYMPAWNLTIADICTADLVKDVDAAMLDIPNPWEALENIRSSLRTGGHVGCYVPNANQLDSTVRRMRELGFKEVVSFETIQREMIVHEGGVRPSFDMLGHTGYLAFGRKMDG
ncbi:MAG: tRNA (adenine-N1)-methyltransferase [Thermoplasmata archaeon]|jgi:tRNA (adenine57-N1/adenine58-N1)-methyltransferase|nr:tRNA (adenine-N1)-methyltransferase [Thermoplasmata archaeon]